MPVIVNYSFLSRVSDIVIPFLSVCRYYADYCVEKVEHIVNFFII